MYEWLFNPVFPECEEKDEKQQMQPCHDEECECSPSEVGQPEGKGKREEHQDCDNDQEENDC